MNDLTDQQLLRNYVERRSESDFAELVRRRVDFVYSAALRMVCDSHLAQDVTQSVFLALAQNAEQLTERPVLSGWLHRTAQNIASKSVRTEVRRRAREQEAVAMNELLAHEPDVIWENIAPYLDAALSELSEPDRDALLLRYFERKSAREMAATLNVSEEAAQKRVNRAVERLREFFSKRKVTIGASGLAVLISTNAVQAAPIGLALSISTAVALVGTAVQTSTAIAATKTIVMTTLQKTLILGTLTAAVSFGIFQARQTSDLRNQLKILKEQKPQTVEQVPQSPGIAKNLDLPHDTGEQLQKLETELRKSQSEILRLRSSVAHSIADRTQAEEMRTELERLSNGPLVGVLEKDGTFRTFNPATNDWARSVNKQALDQTKFRELKKVGQLTRKLALSPEQEDAIKNLVLQAIENRQKPKTASSLDELASWGKDEEKLKNQIRQMLSPEQQSGYDDFLQGQIYSQAKSEADREIMNLQNLLGLNAEQQEQVFNILFQEKMKSIPNSAGFGLSREDYLNRKIKPLEGILSSSEIEIYKNQMEKSFIGNK